MHEDIHEHGALQFSLLSQSPAQHHARVETDAGQQTPQQAILAEVLRIAANCVAREDESDDAQTDIGKAAEQTDLPRRHW